jgi:PAS domain S-box-containing protein
MPSEEHAGNEQVLLSADPAGTDHLQALNQQLLSLNQELIDGEQRLRLAIETGRIGLWVWNSTDVANSGDWSPRLKEIFGIPQDVQVTHDIFLECVHPEDRERVNTAVMQALAGMNGGTYQAEYRTIHPRDGSLHWVTARAQAFFDKEGKPFRFIGTLMEITERKQVEEVTRQLNQELEHRIAKRTADLELANRTLTSEAEERKRAVEALRQSEDHFRKAIDTVPGLVWSAMPDGYIDYLNKRWLDFTGLSHEVASGWGWQSAIHPDDLPGLVEYWISILKAEQAGEYEARLRSVDGTYRWFLFRGVPLRDETGKLIKWYGTNTDVEDLRASKHLAQGQLAALTGLLDLLAKESDPDKLPEHVVTTIHTQIGAHSVTIWERNGDALDLLGIVEEGVFRTRNAAHYFGGSIPAVGHAPPLWVEGLHGGDHLVLEDVNSEPSRIILADGRTANWFRDDLTPPFAALKEHLVSQGVRGLLISPMMFEGQLAGIIGVRFKGNRVFECREIELMKALAHQAMLALQLMRLSRKSRQAAVMGERNRLAQDIHDTLAQGLTGIVVQIEAAEDARSKGLGTEADQHLHRAVQLARESLHEARASVHALRPRALKEQQLCSALAELIDRTTRGTNLVGKFTAVGEPQRLPDVWEQNILRMVQEGLGNSLRHAQATRFEAKLTFSVPEVRLELIDNGRGFNVATTQTGLGLQGMKERTEAMGGTVAIESEPGKGTRIHAILPTLAKTDAQA